MKLHLSLSLLLLSIVFGGCGRKAPPRVAPANAPAASSSTDDQADEALQVPSQSAAKTEIAPEAASPALPSARDGADASDAEATADAVRPAKTARIVLLAPRGPLLIDLHLTRGSQSLVAAFENAVDTIWNIATAETADKRLTWKTLLAHPRFREGQFGNPASGNLQAQLQAIRQYDTTQNDRVDRDEFINYLSNNSSSRPLSFFTSNNGLQVSRASSALAELFDQNHDRWLDEQELSRAIERLEARDINNDGVLFPAELDDALAAGEQAPPRTRGSPFRPPLGWIFPAGEDHFLWSDILVAWQNQYAHGQALRRGDFAKSQRTFDALELDGDGTIDPIEMEMILELAPDLALQLDFSSTPPQLELLASRFPPTDIRSLIQHQANRITLRLEDTTLDLFGVSLTPTPEPPTNQAMTFVQRFDMDQDGGLTRQEFASADNPPRRLPFAAFDIDSNQSVSPTEVATILEQPSLLARNRIQIRADSRRDALFPLLDHNCDGKLDSREMALAAESLSLLDENHDGRLESQEFRAAFLIGVGVGNTDTNRPPTGLAQVPVVRKPQSEGTPRWFVGMDRNEDQTISWREFLGTREQFRKLDQDDDGFLDLTEASRG